MSMSSVTSSESIAENPTHEEPTGRSDARALTAFAALGQSTRLAMLRLLVGRMPHGLTVGEIALAIGCPQNTASGHLAILARAQLVSHARHGRSVAYSAQFEGVRWLVDYLMADCCNGHPSECAVPTIKDCTGKCIHLPANETSS